jgi:hypothetical protein
VPTNEPHVFFPSAKFEFTPVEVGLDEYPIQVYEIYNAGDLPARLLVDDSSLDEFNADNYGCTVLECLSSGVELVVPPRACVETKWRFAPLEAKTYQADVLFRVNETSFTLITFKCIGFDKRKLQNGVASQSSALAIPEKQKFLVPNQVCFSNLSFRIKCGGDFIFIFLFSWPRSQSIGFCSATCLFSPGNVAFYSSKTTRPSIASRLRGI